jgi:uncharacterized protein YutE (UPF0331/DUF86 family)
MSDAGRRLPRPIATRLADLRRHHRALLYAMGGFGEDFDLDAFAAASASADPEELARVYAVERPFELVDNYVVELAVAGLEAAGTLEPGEDPGGGIAALRRLRDAGVVSQQRCDRLERVHRVRTEIQHEYPDVRSRSVHEAAYLLASELPGFLRDYARWLRELGFGKSQ